MERKSRKEFYKELLLMVFAVSLIICLVVFLFFRSSVTGTMLKNIMGMLTPFIYGFAIAYLLHPTCHIIDKFLTRLQDRFLKKKHPGMIRTISLLLAIIFMILIIALLLVLVLPELITSISVIAAELPKAVNNFSDWISSLDQGDTSHEAVTTVQQVVNTLTTQLEDFLKTSLLPSMNSLVSNVTSSFFGLFNFLKDFGLGIIVSAYLLGGWEKFGNQAKLIVYSILPKKYADWIAREVRYTDKMFDSFIHGKLLDSLIIGILCFLFCTITSMPYGLLVSVIVGVTNIIPFFGPYIGAIPSLLLILTINPIKCLIFLIFIILLQQFDGNILGPAILGDRLGISGIWILFSIMLFSHFWGFAGMLIGVPLFAVIYDLIRRSVVTGLKKRRMEKLISQYQDRFE